ncbi:hypothetical protein PBI_FLOOF_67 [Microbacterium phage Floof]|uniref:Uncharacterized protein n=1 Tax=Microbacterium phage Floof TaxID=2201433 RepID=A0A2Z4Q479_9CAUD|nr:hypothetical protein PBI_FLOOF_67 [Microbacterium phage Floof]
MPTPRKEPSVNTSPAALTPSPAKLTLVPVPLHRDTDDDLLEEPRERRIHHDPRPALRDPLASPAYRARFGTSGGAAQRGTRRAVVTLPDLQQRPRPEVAGVRAMFTRPTGAAA